MKEKQLFGLGGAAIAACTAVGCADRADARDFDIDMKVLVKRPKRVTLPHSEVSKRW